MENDHLKKSPFVVDTMNQIEKDFLRYLKLKELQTGKKIIQNGGVIERVRIGVHNIEYDINSHNDSPIELIAISTKKSNDKQPSFIMTIMPGDYSILQSLNRGYNCFEDDHDQSSDIVLAALEIAKLKGAKTFEFTDNSTKTIEGKKIRLADLSFLTTGKTWYERILPIKISLEENRNRIDSWRSTVKSNKWIDVYNKLKNKGIKAEFNTKDIDISEPGSAMKVLDKAKKERKNYKFFNEFMIDLSIASDVPRLHGETWKMLI